MSTLKVNAIRGTGASSDAISVNSTDGTCTAKITNNLSNRNLIINGAFNVAQRGTSSTSTSYQTVDRFLNSINGGTVTQAQHALTSSDTGPWAKGFRNSYHQTNTSSSSDAAANFRNIYYYVEAQDLANSGWDYTSSSSYITLSFWAKSSLAGTYYIQLRSQDGTGQNYASPYTLVADTWKKITVKIPGSSNIQVNNDNGAGLIIYWVLDYGTNFTGSMSTDTWGAYSSSTRTPDFAQDWTGTSSATFELTGVQLEVGDYATDFEHRSYGEELARCQRYFFMQADDANSPIGLGAMNTATGIFCHHHFPVAMRESPSIYQVSGTDHFRFFNNGGGAMMNGNWSIWNGRKTNAQITATLDSNLTAGGAAFGVANHASARLGFTAEL